MNHHVGAQLFGWTALIGIFLIYISVLMNRQRYDKKPRPQKTKVRCPVDAQLLSDHELFMGCCVQCRNRNGNDAGKMSKCLEIIQRQQKEQGHE